LSTPDPDYILWQHLKALIDNNKYLSNFVNLTNVYTNISFWPLYFKISTSIIISKLNKVAYSSSKNFYSIILLNTLGKIIEKVIGKRLQTQFIASNFTYPNQLRGLKQCFTTDAGLYLTYLIYTE